ncbi:MAG: diguanylate cyclase [Lachnospiraceae bacterium]|nr:diguanylate cyclase [Lachnospiraceae bacterium]
MKNIIGAITCTLISYAIAICGYMFTHGCSFGDLAEISVEDKRFLLVLLVAQTIIVWTYFFYILTIRKRNANRLKTEENRQLLLQRRYQIVIDNSGEMMYEISLNNDACISTDKIREKFGWDIPKQVDNLDVRKLFQILHVHPEDEALFYNSTSGLITNKMTKEITVRMQKADGTYIWCNIIYIPLLDGDNNMVSIVGKIEDVDSEVKEKERLEHQSRTDGLTGLMNKQTFEEEAMKFLMTSISTGSALLFIDMDYFKDVNDKFGHTMGDRAIRDIALKLQVIFANCDMVSRFGGDEFLIFVKNIPRDTLLDKLAWAVEKLKETYSNGVDTVNLSASIGVAYCMADKIAYNTLLEAADNSLYAAKELGRSRYIIRDVYS